MILKAYSHADERFDESCVLSSDGSHAYRTRMRFCIPSYPRAAYRAYDEFDESCVEKCDN